MIKNYLLVALRNFSRERFYSLLNITGLAAGLCCALLILLWVRDELSVDRFHRDLDKLHLVYAQYHSPSGETITWTNTPGKFGEWVRENVSGVDQAARTMHCRQKLMKAGDKSFISDGLYAEHDFFDVFSFKILSGKMPDNREDKSNMMLSETLAKKLFGSADVVGRAFQMDTLDVMVAGVFEDVPASSSIQFEFIAPFQVYKDWRGPNYNWGQFDFRLYLKLENPDKAATVTAAIERKWDEMMKESGEENNFNFLVRPFGDTYLQSEFRNGVPEGGKMVYVKIFTVVAIFILLIACVNFMNMATARALSRSKEIGIRKVVGAARKSLVLQFMGEAVLTSAIAMIIALGAAALVMPGFNALLGKQIAIQLTQPFMIVSVIAMILITGLLSGSYPAFVLSSFSPRMALKGLSSRLHGTKLRHTLVIFQFVLAVVLIICSIATFRQINYMLNKDLGYDRHAVISFPAGAIAKNFAAFREDMLANKNIIELSRANGSLVNITNHSNGVVWPGKVEDEDLFRVVEVDFHFVETMKLKLMAGRGFSEEFNDTNNVIITNASAGIMGFRNPIGQKISVWGTEGTIVGVVDDFHSQSLKAPIEPAVLLCKPGRSNTAYMRFAESETAQVVSLLETTFKKYNPDFPFSYRFMDDDFENMYKTEKTAGSLAIGFTIIAILISGLGLLGLTTYSTERRKKEIGIRKTLGASVSGLVANISVEFVRLGVIAFVIACPLAWWVMNDFLETYTYHTNLGWQVFAMTGLITLTLTTIIVVYQVLKAATVNPVEVLRNE